MGTGVSTDQAVADAIEARFRLPYGDFALDVDLRLPGRGVSVLLGDSGSGKTTLLRCIAGLETAADGSLRVNGELWQDGRTIYPCATICFSASGGLPSRPGGWRWNRRSNCWVSNICLSVHRSVCPVVSGSA
jgi:energy-coupling factor transporter ATP-binding protein EcfA2